LVDKKLDVNAIDLKELEVSPKQQLKHTVRDV